jgi:hypothetical protein
VDGLDRGRPMVRGPALVDLSQAIPGQRPSGILRMTRFAPDESVAALNPPYGQPEAINALIDIRIFCGSLRV